MGMGAQVKVSHQVTINSPGARRVLKVLRATTVPLTKQEIAPLAHVTEVAFQNNYRHVLLAAGLIHLAEWRRVRGPARPAYLAGPGTGAEPTLPPATTNAERSKKWKERTCYNEARSAVRSLARPRDPVLAALLGLRP